MIGLERAPGRGDMSAFACGATPLPPYGGRAAFPPLSGRPPLQWRGAMTLAKFAGYDPWEKEMWLFGFECGMRPNIKGAR